MRIFSRMLAATALVLSMMSAGVAAEGLGAEKLRCEYRVDPAGIDVARPRLSWIVTSPERGQVQSAYQVLVASSSQILDGDAGDIWDSGKVASDETAAVEYGGRPLVSRERVWWKVRAWDRDGKPGPWSEPASWSMGLLEPADWQAQWIGLDQPDRPEPDAGVLGEAQWIQFKAGEKGARLFRREFTLPEGRVERATMWVGADRSFNCHVNGDYAAFSGQGSLIFEMPFAEHLKAGRNVMVFQVTRPDAGPALIVAAEIIMEDGRRIELASDGEWQARSDLAEGWQRDMGPAGEGWSAVELAGAYGAEPWGEREFGPLFLPGARYLRREFEVTRPIARATIYATALGIYELRLNGERVGRDYFNPGWTDYEKRVYYHTYDVTEQARRGANVLGAMLADGWYSGFLGYTMLRDHYGKNPRLLAQLEIEYEDGSSETIATDGDWRGSLGPILEADFLMGETYDARLEMAGWDAPAFDASKWQPIKVGAEVQPLVQAALDEPVVIFAELEPKSVAEPAPGVYVLDMGQNFAGVVRLSVEGRPGQRIQLLFGERLKPDGLVYTENMRNARVVDTYICKGEGVETWTPSFTFHGFQYVEVHGLEAAPAPGTIVGLAMSSDTPDAGELVTNDPMLDQLLSNIRWTQRMNFLSIPTDCPQRDERLGWTGDAQVYIRTATLNSDVQAFFSKWLVDLNDAQREDGQFPRVAPLKVTSADGGPAWADAGVICPWTMYEVYGDRRILESCYPHMQRFIAFTEGRVTDELLPPAQFHCFGDWLNIQDDTPRDVIFMAYWALSTQLTARTAEVLGHSADAERYEALHGRIKAAFNKAYVGEDGRIKGDTQTAYVLALAHGLVEGERREQAAARLIELIEARDGHLSTGFIGTKDLMLVLAAIGRNDVAYRLLHNESFPSWGFSIRQGATSIWERWDGWTPEKGFQTPGMNSFAHYSFGAVAQWMYENIGGIRASEPGYRRMVIRPEPGGTLSEVQASYESIRGPITTAWRSGPEGAFSLDVTIPANTRAEIHVPAESPDVVREGDRPAAEAAGVRYLRMESGAAVYEVGSGTYRWTSRRGGAVPEVRRAESAMP